VIGAFAYDKVWNERVMYVTRLPDVAPPFILRTKAQAQALAKQPGGEYFGPTPCNVDFTFCRFRLWSWADSIIGYYVVNFREARKQRIASGWTRLSVFRRKPRQ
jgi:hypothetical protein